MKKGLIVGIFLLFIVLMLSFVSAGFFSDLWAKITGKDIGFDECPFECPTEPYVYECGYYYPSGCSSVYCGVCALHEKCISNQCQYISYSSISNCADCTSLGYFWCLDPPYYCIANKLNCELYVTSGTCPYLECVDNDNDGYNAYNYWTEEVLSLLDYCGPVDCDDNNANIHPGATDICENGIDENCDGSDADCAPTVYCTDSDGGTIYDVAGTATDSSGPIPDTCDSATVLREAICVGPFGATAPYATTVTYDCSDDGKVCSGGRCIVPTIKCSDSDGGIILNVFGTASDSSGTTTPDSCIDENTLREAYCTGTVGATGPHVATTTESCTIGEQLCKSGRCIPCQDKDNDGYYAQGGECGTTADCRDNNAAVNPGATEIPNNGIDDDCVGGDAVAVCTDYDGGEDYYEASRVTDMSGDEYDYCSGNTLYEAICTSSNIADFVTYNCASEGMQCSERRCVEVICTDTCASLGYECGYQSVCGAQKYCGTCGSNEYCSDGICRTIECEDTCASLGYECGSQMVCGQSTNCGTCGSNEVCQGGTCVYQAPACTDTCSSLGYECGWNLVCGKSTNCGTCGSNEYCNTQGQCVYQAPACTDTCSSLGYECGNQIVCGQSRSCGTCGSGKVCSGGHCVTSCTDTCASLGYECGNQIVCGQSRSCGTCGSGQNCIAGECVTPPITCTDNDGDGYSQEGGEECGAEDCDDNNAAIHPNAPEICENNIDENCDGSDAVCPGPTTLPGTCMKCVEESYTWCLDTGECLEPGETCTNKANHDYQCPSCIESYDKSKLGLSSTGVGAYVTSIESGCSLDFTFGSVLNVLPLDYNFSVPNKRIVKILNVSSSNPDRSAILSLTLNENEFKWPLQNVVIYIEESKTTWLEVPESQRQLEKLTTGEGIYEYKFNAAHFSLFLITEPDYCGNGDFESNYYEECDGSAHCTSECICETGYTSDGSGACVEEADNKACSNVGTGMCIGFNLYECGEDFQWDKVGIVVGNCSVECAPVGNESCNGEIPLKCGSDYKWFSQSKVNGLCGYVSSTVPINGSSDDCGNGYCGYYEDEFNCPEDCTPEKSSSKWILFLVIGIIVLLIIIVAVFFFRIYNKERKKKASGPPDRKIPPAHRPGPKREPGRPPIIHHGQIGRPPERMVHPDRRIPPEHRPGPKREPGRPSPDRYPVQRYPR